MSKKLKVFHGTINYGTQAGLFSAELRKRGIDSYSLGWPDPFKRQIDFELLHGGNLFQKIYRHLFNVFIKIRSFIKYNTFHFYYGKSLFESGIDLWFYKFLGKKVVMEYLGNDIHLHTVLIERYQLPKSHIYNLHPLEHDKKIKKRYDFEKQFIDKMLVCSPCYAEFADDAETLTLAIEVEKYPIQELTISDKIVIMHAPTDRVFKGSQIIEGAIAKLQNEGYSIEYNMVQGVTHAQLIEHYKKAHIFIDQISTGWYGTASVEAMALGIPTMVFYDSLYSKYIDYFDEIAAINISEKTIYSELKKLLDNKHELPNLSKKMRGFVEKHHNVDKITNRLIAIYQELHNSK